MQRHSLFALSTLDGFVKMTSAVAEVFSEGAFFKYRIMLEIQWLRRLASLGQIPQMPSISIAANAALETIIRDFSEEDAKAIKQMDGRDGKGVEYFIKKKMSGHPELHNLAEFIHFGCTSEDINNLAYGLMITKGRNDILVPAIIDLVKALTQTTMDKELCRFAERLRDQVNKLYIIKIKGKLNGERDGHSTLKSACPAVDWEKVCEDFVVTQGLTWNGFTAHIEPHDYIVEILDTVKHINNILRGCSRDMLRSNKGTEGVDYTEGNLGMANALMAGISDKLPISRLQRDLSDSTVLRNIGIAFGHSLLAYDSLIASLAKLNINSVEITHRLLQ
jgi:adenylosuccinate lyase